MLVSHPVTFSFVAFSICQTIIVVAAILQLPNIMESSH